MAILPGCRLGVAGIAMDIRLLVCRFIWDDGFGSISDALECLRLCKEEGAHVSSNSWGGVPHSSKRDRPVMGRRAVATDARQRVQAAERTHAPTLTANHPVPIC